jgi:hypothetical protein
MLLLLNSSLSHPHEVNVTSRIVQQFEYFKSKYVDARNIDVWLPDGYSANYTYVVLYKHYSNMFFDATSTWNK